jgi:uncharacterized membrane protein
MLERYVPILCGLLAVVSLISLITLLFHLIGFGKGDALYLACLTVAVPIYLVSRKVLRRK